MVSYNRHLSRKIIFRTVQLTLQNTKVVYFWATEFFYLGIICFLGLISTVIEDDCYFLGVPKDY